MSVNSRAIADHVLSHDVSKRNESTAARCAAKPSAKACSAASTNRAGSSATRTKPSRPYGSTTSVIEVETTGRPAARYSGVLVGLMKRVDTVSGKWQECDVPVCNVRGQLGVSFGSEVVNVVGSRQRCRGRFSTTGPKSTKLPLGPEARRHLPGGRRPTFRRVPRRSRASGRASELGLGIGEPAARAETSRTSTELGKTWQRARRAVWNDRDSGLLR